MEWLNLVVRWIHVITGVAWIGTSFYFNWLEGSLDRKGNRSKDVAGDLWAIHGGGFYHITKYKVAPDNLPETLHWFKWEAYFTWISGFALLGIVYYHGAAMYLVDPYVADIPAWGAILIGVASLGIGWYVYDSLCRSLSKSPVTLSVVGFVLMTGAAWLLGQFFTPRGAYIHVGAILGTIMAANVFRVIIPNQKDMVDDMKEGKNPDPEPGRAALQRSLHNNYLTLPVLFIMVSNHYPVTFGHPWNWAVLAAISLVGMGVRHHFNLKNQGNRKKWILPVAAGAMVALALVSNVTANLGNEIEGPPIAFREIQPIIQKRCASCHSAVPTDDVYTIAPNGVMFDTPKQIQKWADTILQRSVILKNMPLGNKTGITDEERHKIGRWIKWGAKLD